MLRVDKHVTVQVSPQHTRAAIEIKLLELVEEHLNFKPYIHKGTLQGGLSHLKSVELKPMKPNTRRFYIEGAYTQRDK